MAKKPEKSRQISRQKSRPKRRQKSQLTEKSLNSRKGQRTNQKYWNLEGSDQQMQRPELGKADRTVGVNCYCIYFPMFRQACPTSSGNVYN